MTRSATSPHLRRGLATGQLLAQGAEPGEGDPAQRGDLGGRRRGAGRGRCRPAGDRPRATWASPAVARSTTTPVDPVQEMTTSAPARAADSSSSGRAVPPVRSARRTALARVRLTMVRPAAPRGRRWWRPASSSPPAPTTSTLRPASGPELALGPGQPGLDQRDADRVDAGLGVGPLADPQGLLEEGVEGRARRGRTSATRAGRCASGRGSGPRRPPSSRARRRP